MIFSTIAAISTPRGKGGVSLIRISGPEAFLVADKIFRPKNGKSVLDLTPRFQTYGDIISFEEKDVIDDGLLTCFSAPNSFTGENVVEIACHGGEVITAMVLSAVLAAGAEMAKAGEFSRRAFLNGKLSLTSAEGIADLLDAKTEAAAKLFSKTSRGKLSVKIKEISDSILSISSSLWAYLDYPEEDLQSLTDDEIVSIISFCTVECEKLISSFQIGKAVNSGISSVIVGKPNAGKSTFFNALLGENRAIVTEIPGTTRDVIEYPVKAGNVLLNLADTAGVRSDTCDQVEKIGIEKALNVLDDAELVFALFDQSRPLDEDDKIVISRLKNLDDSKRIISIFTKADLPRKLDPVEIPDFGLSFEMNYEDEQCLLQIFDAIEKHFITDADALREGNILTNFRQMAQVQKTKELLNLATDQILLGQKDVASLTLEEALSVLLEVDGKSAGEMILDQVFSRFCVGK